MPVPMKKVKKRMSNPKLREDDDLLSKKDPNQTTESEVNLNSEASSIQDTLETQDAQEAQEAQEQTPEQKVEASSEAVPTVSLDEALEGSTSATSQGKPSKGGGGRESLLSVVKSERNGKRVQYSKYLHALLGSPKKVLFHFTESELIIFKDLDQKRKSFLVKESKGKGTIYSTELVEEIAERYELDYSSRVSISFYEMRTVQTEDQVVVYIKIK